MLNAIIDFSIRNKLIVGMFLIILIAWGSYSVTRLPIDAVPDITNNQVQVITVAPSQSALDIERQVTFPVEQSMATIAGLEEIRSFSRFGLSVVTIVFEEDVDVYWARQQVSERLTEAKKQIPSTLGTPELAPITTGLGEIYQYIVKAKPGHEEKFSVMELRTIQDWIIRRQLLGTKGVADVSSFGGQLKQYEIALSTDKLKSLNLSIQDVFTALEDNNENTGGAYIEQNSNAYFIRSEGLVRSFDDLGNILIRTSDSGIPLLLKDVGIIRPGSAIRYGAMTENGNGETVGGVVMMLKGANSSEVIANVKARIAEIEKTLPEGVTIDPFLDRTKLVNHAIETVTKNLAEGALIVIFVLVLLLGNMRAGLVVASVIPLAMLFAITMMNMFGVSGNLMSLGALDFGLIIDGAVIIVEATLHHITVSGFNTKLTQNKMDEEVGSSAKKMMNAAAFGQVIILIVYLPILSLVGIEGKMFRPMAQTVIFAIIGAFILSLTYVPVASALFLSKLPVPRKNVSDRIIESLQRFYQPILSWSLSRRKMIIGLSILLLVVSGFIFTTLGGEFLPELDEGDFAVETRLLTGSNLTTTIDATLKGEEVILKNFPEAEKVIAKIGSAEIPTDPMPIEAADLMIIMKEKSEWVTAETKDEMIEKMQEKLSEAIPGVWFGFEHPIQMRFNELMTGARQDVVLKIYGENLEQLTQYASRIGKLAKSIEGSEGIYIENISGLPQIIIKIRRDQLSRFNLNIKDVNMIINASLGGYHAGLVFEGEKRFDIVVRLNEASRKSISDIQNINITSPAGLQVPLMQVADVVVESGPNQIQRDDAKRRIVVGFNTRGRDVESIVEELQEKVSESIKFQPGYYVTYGGSFKNLQEARARLAIAVPVALVLIFVLLYFAVGSVKQGLLIYTAIPLSAIGGVIALWLRGMPFSISAGVGFIALFGVAVLNGIVLISEFNRLKKEGMMNLSDIIMKGTETRLRPVIMTALVASLGFLPMALSQGSGAEVQKPLATVVIGGLISATILTLIVLPVLYMITENVSWKFNKKTLMFPLILLLGTTALAQEGKNQSISLQEAMDLAIKHHARVQAASLETSAASAHKRTWLDIPKTDINLLYGQYNSIVRTDNNITISQSIPFPTTFHILHKLSKQQVVSAKLNELQVINEVTSEVKKVYNLLLFLNSRKNLLQQYDSVMQEAVRIAALQYKTGEGTKLSLTAAETQALEIHNNYERNDQDIITALKHLQILTQSDQPANVKGTLNDFLPDASADVINLESNPSYAFSHQQVLISQLQRKSEAAKVLPDIHVGYFNQTLIGTQTINGQEQYFGASQRFQGFQLGLSIPLWFVPYTSKVRAASFHAQSKEKEHEAFKRSLEQEYIQAVNEYQKNQKTIDYYKTKALQNTEDMIRQSNVAFRVGEIDYNTLLFNVTQAIRIKEGYLNALYQFNESKITLQYLQGYNK